MLKIRTVCSRSELDILDLSLVEPFEDIISTVEVASNYLITLQLLIMLLLEVVLAAVLPTGSGIILNILVSLPWSCLRELLLELLLDLAMLLLE